MDLPIHYSYQFSRCIQLLKDLTTLSLNSFHIFISFALLISFIYELSLYFFFLLNKNYIQMRDGIVIRGQMLW